ncbi:MAG: hypothetical protein GY780_03145 [bacterium]|nr:hypothetical protein [bacterium]
MSVRGAVFVLVWLLFWPSTGQTAGFSKVGTWGFQAETWFTGSRNIALGQADLAMATGPLAILKNPAVAQEGLTVMAGYESANWISDYDIRNWAAAGEWKFLRMGVVRHEMAIDDMIIRTAYNPEGTGETFNSSEQIWTTGLSADFLPAALTTQGFFGFVGFNWNHYSRTTSSSYNNYNSFASTDDFDLGLTLGWEKPVAQGLFSLAVSAMEHNFQGNTISIDDRETLLPHYYEMGLTLNFSFFSDDQKTEEFRFLLAASNHRDDYYDADRVGAEFVILDAVSIRVGNNDRPITEGSSMTSGVGVKIARKHLNPFEVRLNWATYDLGNLGGLEDMFGATVGVVF